jgi:hypothetical protein
VIVIDVQALADFGIAADLGPRGLVRGGCGRRDQTGQKCESRAHPELVAPTGAAATTSAACASLAVLEDMLTLLELTRLCVEVHHVGREVLARVWLHAGAGYEEQPRAERDE